MATIPATALGALIREKRIAQGMSVPGLARLVGCHYSNVHSHESGRSFPKKTLHAYVEVLGIHRAELIEATGLSSYELSALGCDLFDAPPAPDPGPVFFRHQIHANWYGSVDLSIFGA